MKYKIEAPAKLNGVVGLPSSKSISNRALVMNALAGGGEMPRNLSDCDDTDVMIAALRDMPYEINIKAAGTAMRFLTAYLSVTEGEHVITGTDRMKHRPIRILVDCLRELGAEIDYVGEEGFPPLRIKGHRLEGGKVKIAGNVSSQYISALLMVGPVLAKGLSLQLTGEIISRPYIDMTLGMMQQFGAEAEWTDVDTVEVKPGGYKATPYTIESDWSASSYWYEMLLLSDDENAELRLKGLMDGSLQGDSVVRYIFSLLGVKSHFETDEEGNSVVRIARKGMTLPRLQYDFQGCPDLAQTVVCACCGLGIKFDFTGLSTLKIKETDRIEALKVELRKLGFVLHDRNDNELIWDGERCEASMEPIDTYEDHRMAMAFAPLAFVMEGIVINNPEVVSKSYPKYWDDLKGAGFLIDESMIL